MVWRKGCRPILVDPLSNWTKVWKHALPGVGCSYLLAWRIQGCLMPSTVAFILCEQGGWPREHVFPRFSQEGRVVWSDVGFKFWILRLVLTRVYCLWCSYVYTCIYMHMFVLSPMLYSSSFLALAYLSISSLFGLPPKALYPLSTIQD